MPYYSVEITVPACPAIGCNRPATYEVRTPANGTMGRYCKRHADQRVEDMNDALLREIRAAATEAGTR